MVTFRFAYSLGVMITNQSLKPVKTFVSFASRCCGHYVIVTLTQRLRCALLFLLVDDTYTRVYSIDAMTDFEK